jgi:hypothetical protein
MLGLEHVASRGSISIEYYGRDVGIKIMPTGVKPERFLNGFGWQDTIWRRGELLSQASALGSDLLSRSLGRMLSSQQFEHHSARQHLSPLSWRMPLSPRPCAPEIVPACEARA